MHVLLLFRLILNQIFCCICLSSCTFTYIVFSNLFINLDPRILLLSTVSSVSPSGVTEGVGSLWTSLSSSLEAPSTCQEDVCHNGATCHPVFLSGGTFSFHCDCPLHFTGHFCEQGNQSSHILKTSPEGTRELQPYCTQWQIIAQTRNICIILFKNEFW